MKFLKPIMCSLVVAMMANTANAAPTKLTEKSSNDDILKVLSGTWFGCDSSTSVSDEFADFGAKSASMDVTFVVKDGELINMPKVASLYTQSNCKGKPIESQSFDVNEGFAIDKQAVIIGTEKEVQGLLKKDYLEIELVNNIMVGNQDDGSYTLYLSNDGKKLIVDIFDDYVVFTKKK